MWLVCRENYALSFEDESSGISKVQSARLRLLPGQENLGN
jgi:hypothetical protein